ncbi:MAG: adenylate kinase family protein [Thermoplasmata archaeon]
MRVGITGTPGVGKSTVLNAIDTKMNKVHLSDWAREFYRSSNEEIEVCIDDMVSYFSSYDNTIFEGHLAHYLPLDKVIVLRCDPVLLKERYMSRQYPNKKIIDNLECEALDLILIESINIHGKEKIYEYDTTKKTIKEVGDYIQSVIDGKANPQVGIVDRSEYILTMDGHDLVE